MIDFGAQVCSMNVDCTIVSQQGTTMGLIALKNLSDDFQFRPSTRGLLMPEARHIDSKFVGSAVQSAPVWQSISVITAAAFGLRRGVPRR